VNGASIRKQYARDLPDGSFAKGGGLISYRPTARLLGIDVPPKLLALANEVTD
jgi:hypothetical protein